MTDLPPDLPTRSDQGAGGRASRAAESHAQSGYGAWMWLLGAVASVLVVAWGIGLTSDPVALPGAHAAGDDTQSAAASDGDGAIGDGDANALPPENLPPAPSTPVPAPGGGTIYEEAPEGTDTSITVPIDREATVLRTDTGAVVAKIAKVQLIDAVATQPGETSGPAVAVTVEVRNSTDKALDMPAVTVDLLDATDSPGQGILGKPADWLRGTLEAGATREGVYVFRVDQSKLDPVSITVTLGGETATAVFTGPAD